MFVDFGVHLLGVRLVGGIVAGVTRVIVPGRERGVGGFDGSRVKSPPLAMGARHTTVQTVILILIVTPSFIGVGGTGKARDPNGCSSALQTVKRLPILARRGIEKLVGSRVVGDLLFVGVQFQGPAQTLGDAAEREKLGERGGHFERRIASGVFTPNGTQEVVHVVGGSIRFRNVRQPAPHLLHRLVRDDAQVVAFSPAVKYQIIAEKELADAAQAVVPFFVEFRRAGRLVFPPVVPVQSRRRHAGTACRELENNRAYWHVVAAEATAARLRKERLFMLFSRDRKNDSSHRTQGRFWP